MVFALDSVPRTVVWIKNLKIKEATDQCNAWGLIPKETLGAMREQLREFVLSKKGAVDDEVGPVSQTEATDLLVDLDGEVADESKRTVDEVTSERPATHLDSIISDPNVGALITALQGITMQAVDRTARAVADTVTARWNDEHKNSRLPAVVENMLKELPKVSDTNLKQLVKFLTKLSQIIKLNLTSEHNIIVNAAPLTSGSLRNVWMESVVNGLNWSQLQTKLRESLFSHRVLREVQNEMLYRLQQSKETLAEYVEDVNSLFDFLAPNTCSKDIFETLITGLNPQTRAALVGIPPPSSVEDLIRISPLVESQKATARQYQAPPFIRDNYPQYNRPRPNSFQNQGSWPAMQGPANRNWNPSGYRPSSNFRENTRPHYQNFRPRFPVQEHNVRPVRPQQNLNGGIHMVGSKDSQNLNSGRGRR